MKLRKKTRNSKRKTPGDGENNGGTDGRVSISDMPIEILIDIHSRLSIKNIFRCRSVCKLWLQVLLSDAFAKFHFSVAPVCPLLRNTASKTINRALYLIELERDLLCYICDGETNVAKTTCARNCNYHAYEGHVNLKISTGLMLPAFKGGVYTVVNSCNGLLCLRKGYNSYYDPTVIFNPVTSDVVRLPFPPRPADNPCVHKVTFGGLGFCPVSNEYKVLVLIYQRKDPAHHIFNSNMAVVFSLKSGTWKRVSDSPPILRRASDPTVLNGSLHWLVGNWSTNNLIIYFDFVNHQFHTMLPPRHMCCGPDSYDRDRVLKGLKHNLNWRKDHISDFRPMRDKSLGVLRGKIVLSDSSSENYMEVWVMNDYGVEDSWVKMFHLDEFSNDNVFFPMRFSKPIDYLKNGDLLMYDHLDNALTSHDGDDSRYFKIGRFRTKFQAIPHIPSFKSLKEIVADNMEVMNVRASNELQKQKVNPLILREDDPVKRTYDIDDPDDPGYYRGNYSDSSE